jgi:hypothetical protein
MNKIMFHLADWYTDQLWRLSVIIQDHANWVWRRVL